MLDLSLLNPAQSSKETGVRQDSHQPGRRSSRPTTSPSPIRILSEGNFAVPSWIGTRSAGWTSTGGTRTTVEKEVLETAAKLEADRDGADKKSGKANRADSGTIRLQSRYRELPSPTAHSSPFNLWSCFPFSFFEIEFSASCVVFFFPFSSFFPLPR